jgi:hypothetical protein
MKCRETGANLSFEDVTFSRRLERIHPIVAAWEEFTQNRRETYTPSAWSRCFFKEGRRTSLRGPSITVARIRLAGSVNGNDRGRVDVILRRLYPSGVSNRLLK